MLKVVLHLLSVTLAFSVNVKVKAHSLKALRDPSLCTLEQVGCAIQADVDQTELSYLRKENQLGMAQGAIILSMQPGQIRLIQGLVRVRAADPIKVLLPQGEVEVTAASEAMLSKSEMEVELTVLKGEVRVFGKSGEGILVQQGKTQKIGALDLAGRLKLEPYLASPWSSTLKSWWRTYPGTKSEFISRAKQLLPLWRQATEAASQDHLDLARRHIAQVQYARQTAKELRQKKAREEAELRALFREMTYADGAERPTLIEPESDTVSP